MMKFSEFTSKHKEMPFSLLLTCYDSYIEGCKDGYNDYHVDRMHEKVSITEYELKCDGNLKNKNDNWR